MENSHYFPHMYAISQQHTLFNVHVDPGNGKLALLSTYAHAISEQHSAQFNVHVDPGNEKESLAT